MMDESPESFGRSPWDRVTHSIRKVYGHRDGYEIVAQVALFAFVVIVGTGIASGLIFLFDAGANGGSNPSFTESLIYLTQFVNGGTVTLMIVFIAFVGWRIRDVSRAIPDDVAARDVEETEGLFTRVWYWRFFCRANLVLTALGVLGSAGLIDYYSNVSGGPVVFTALATGTVTNAYGLMWVVALLGAWLVHRECEWTLNRFVPRAID
jgi:hypothetical protein